MRREARAKKAAEVKAAAYISKQQESSKKSFEQLTSEEKIAYITKAPVDAKNAEEAMANDGVLLHISETPLEEMLVIGNDPKGTLYPGNKLGLERPNSQKPSDKLWFTAGGFEKGFEFAFSHYWKNRKAGTPEAIYVHYLRPANANYARFSQHYLKNGILYSKNMQWFAKSHISKVYPCGVLKFDTRHKTWSEVR